MSERYWLGNTGTAHFCECHDDFARGMQSSMGVMYASKSDREKFMLDAGWVKVVLESKAIRIHGHKTTHLQKVWLLAKVLERKVPIIDGNTRKEFKGAKHG